MNEKTRIWSDIETQMPKDQAKLALSVLKLVQESNGKTVSTVAVAKAAQAVFDEEKRNK